MTLLKALISNVDKSQKLGELTAHRLQDKLLDCGDDFLEFGKDEWMRQCKQTSRFNILDQHLTVKCIIEEPESISEDADEPVELRAASRSNPDETKFQLVKMSTYLFSLAVNDSRRMIDKDIRTRRTQIVAAKEKEAKKKAIQHEVDLRADAIKPTDPVMTLGQRFANKSHAGPHSNSLREFESIHIIGGNDHINRLQTGSGRERSESRAGASTIADAT